MQERLDSKDVEILRTLRKDSRTPMGSIGEQLGTSKATVSRRIARMETEGVISGYSLRIDESKLGLMRSLVMIQVIGAPASLVLENLMSYPEVASAYKAFGDHNIVCEVYTRSVDELYEMIQTKLLKMPSVRNVEVDVLVDSVPMNVNADLDIYTGADREVPR